MGVGVGVGVGLKVGVAYEAMMPITRCSLLSEIGISRRPASRAAAWLGLGLGLGLGVINR